jgi:hypothetical protein
MIVRSGRAHLLAMSPPQVLHRSENAPGLRKLFRDLYWLLVRRKSRDGYTLKERGYSRCERLRVRGRPTLLAASRQTDSRRPLFGCKKIEYGGIDDDYTVIKQGHNDKISEID